MTQPPNDLEALAAKLEHEANESIVLFDDDDKLDTIMADNPGFHQIDPIDREALAKIMALETVMPSAVMTILVAHRLATNGNKDAVIAGLAQDVVDAWEWWNVDTYDRCSTVPGDAIDLLKAALANRGEAER